MTKLILLLTSKLRPKLKPNHVTILVLNLFTLVLNAQNVGVNTTSPDAPLHVGSSGQVQTPGGLFLLGDRSEGHLEIDFNRLQALFNNPPTPLNLLVQPDGGNVGIGLSSPTRKLHLSGTGNQFLAVQTTSVGSSQSGIDLLRSNEFSATDWRIINDGGTLKFMDEINNFSTSGDENMRISNNGYVGIGEISPQARLHLDGDSYLSGSSGGNFLRIGNSSGSYLAFDNNEIGARTNTNIPTTLFMQYWGGNLNLCNDDSGRVGVGLSSPSAKLHVTGGLDVSLTSGGELVLGNISTTNIGMDGNEIQARNNGIASALFVQQSGGDVLLVPNANGQVGIGVTTSANMPSNLYLLAVDGKAIFEEVRVEVSGSWPDYVFQDEYKLLPLQELENKIKAQGHLPGIPKASVVEKEGFDLGDMQKRMLEKIEELTLYMIQANKEITTLKEDNIKLKSIINSIK